MREREKSARSKGKQSKRKLAREICPKVADKVGVCDGDFSWAGANGSHGASLIVGEISEGDGRIADDLFKPKDAKKGIFADGGVGNQDGTGSRTEMDSRDFSHVA